MISSIIGSMSYMSAKSLVSQQEVMTVQTLAVLGQVIYPRETPEFTAFTRISSSNLVNPELKTTA